MPEDLYSPKTQQRYHGITLLIWTKYRTWEAKILSQKYKLTRITLRKEQNLEGGREIGKSSDKIFCRTGRQEDKIGNA